jgi:uncharacterized protein
MADVSVERAESRAAAIANPAPLGVSAFALTTFVLSASNAGFILAQGTGGAMVLGLALFYGGLVQLLAGMWEFRTGNTFGATVFSSYGAFWISLAFSLLPLFGGKSLAELAGATAVGVYLLGWTIFTGYMFLGSMRTTGALMGIFVFLFLTFLFLTIGALAGSTSMTQIGGWLGIITAIVAWYTAAAGVLAAVNSPIKLPTFPMS